MQRRFWEDMMKSAKPLFVCALLLIAALVARSQGDATHFAKEGLSFDYANGWTITDESNSDAQQITLNKANSDAQIRIFVHRGKVDSPEKLAQAKKAFIDPYVKSVNDMFIGMGAKPDSSAATAQV